MKIDPIQNFILESERNLNIAAAVTEAWPETKTQITSEFFNRLGLQLIKELKGWKFELCGHFFIDRYPAFFFWKPGWDDQYSIIIECTNYGEKISFGVWRDEGHIGKRPFCQEILTVVQSIESSAQSRKHWEAYIKMRYPAADWRKPEILWRIHTDKIFLEEVAKQILEIAKVSEPIIDRLVRKK